MPLNHETPLLLPRLSTGNWRDPAMTRWLELLSALANVVDHGLSCIITLLQNVTCSSKNPFAFVHLLL